MGEIIGFVDRLRLGTTTLPAGAAPTRTRFTAFDLELLESWQGDGQRASICAWENGSFAMLYDGITKWAKWGLVRQGARILAWDCVSLADIGRFPSMAAALAALADAGAGVPTIASNVLYLSAAAQTKRRLTAR